MFIQCGKSFADNLEISVKGPKLPVVIGSLVKTDDGLRKNCGGASIQNKLPVKLK